MTTTDITRPFPVSARANDFLVSLILGVALTLISYGLGVAFGWIHGVNALEAFAVFTSYVSTYLCVKQRRFNYIAGGISSVAYSALFFQTDLYSTIGYWLLKHKEFGSEGVPAALIYDAAVRKSDLYVIVKSNIPFEEDPLRYGGDKRESDDEFWIDLCKAHNLNYVVLEAAGLGERQVELHPHLDAIFGKPLEYTRRGSEYMPVDNSDI